MILFQIQNSGSVDQLSEIVALLGPPSDEDLIEMSCSDSTISSLFFAARIRDSLPEALVHKMGPFLSKKCSIILKLLPELLVYNPQTRLTATDAKSFLQDQIK